MKTKILKLNNKEYIEFRPETEMEIFELGQIAEKAGRGLKESDGCISNFKSSPDNKTAAGNITMEYIMFPVFRLREMINE